MHGPRIPSFVFAAMMVLAATELPGHMATAHPVSQPHVLIHVSHDTVRVRFRILAEDLYLFHQLEPDPKTQRISKEQLRGTLTKHRQLLLTRFLLRNAQGQPLKGKFLKLTEPDWPADGIQLLDLMKYDLTFEFVYPTANRLAFLTLDQAFADDLLIPVEVKAEILQEGAGAPFYIALENGAAETVRFDWKHPRLSSEASDAEWAKWQQVQDERAMGLSNYNGVYAFLYIEPHTVRFEILIPLVSLDKVIAVARENPAFLTVEEQAAATEAIIQKIEQATQLTLNQSTVKPKRRQLRFLGLEIEDVARKPKPSKVSMASGRVGLIFTYPAKEIPREAILGWKLFSRQMRNVHLAVLPGEFGYRVRLHPGQPEHRWRSLNRFTKRRHSVARYRAPKQARLRLPIVSCLVLAAIPWLFIYRVRSGWQATVVATICLLVAGFTRSYLVLDFPHPLSEPVTLSQEQVHDIIGALQRQTYRAFENDEENACYDELSKCVSDELIREWYLQVRKTLQEHEQSEAVAQVDRVVLHDAKILPPPQQGYPKSSAKSKRRLQADSHRGAAEQDQRDVSTPRTSEFVRTACDWTVEGTIDHWGHMHRRANRYRAELVIGPTDGYWKIVGFRWLSQELTSGVTRLRQLHEPQ